MLTILVGVACFVAGALVFRNNKATGENLIQRVLGWFSKKK